MTSTWYSKAKIDSRNVNVFFVEDYGAVGDGTTDDTAAINSCVSAAVTAAQASSQYAEVQFQAKTYLVNGSLTQGGATAGNALIPLPVIATTAPKVTLVLKGAGPVAALPHWTQTSVHPGGTLLKTTLTNGTNSGTYGPASVIGGPTTEQGYGTGFSTPWNNMCPVIDGIAIQVPTNSTYCGFDFRGCSEASVPNAAVFNSAIPGSQSVAGITNQWTFGLAMPLVNNNALCDIGEYSCEGLCYGLMPSEHTVALSVRCIYCVTGIEWISGAGTTMPHAGLIVYACVEACDNVVGIYPSGVVNFRILMLDSEATTVALYDPTNLGVGEIYNTGDLGSKTGGSGVKITTNANPPGHVTAPTVPSSTTALTNSFGRDAAVTVTGGTVTVIAVGGTTLGVTSGTVMVPAGVTIALTYSSAPSWVWTLM